MLEKHSKSFQIGETKLHRCKITNKKTTHYQGLYFTFTFVHLYVAFKHPREK
jgi:hypothetical protein